MANKKVTKKEISSEIRTSRISENFGTRFYHEYISCDNKYSISFKQFQSASNESRVTDETGHAISGILQNKKEFIDFLYNHLNT